MKFFALALTFLSAHALATEADHIEIRRALVGPLRTASILDARNQVLEVLPCELSHGVDSVVYECGTQKNWLIISRVIPLPFFKGTFGNEEGETPVLCRPASDQKPMGIDGPILEYRCSFL